MLNLRSMPESELPLGEPLPWDLYDRWGDLLLKQGGKIRDEDMMRDIVVRGPSVLAPDTPADPFLDERSKLHVGTPFDVQRKCVHFLERISVDPLSVDPFPAQVEAIAAALQRAVERDEDAALASLAMLEEGRLCVRHEVETAIVVAAMAKRLQMDAQTSREVVCAALTMNISNLELHESLYHDTAPLSDSTRILMNLHPGQSANLLHHAGVTSKEWLEAVKKHHERWDGSGYPHGLIGSRSTLGAQLIQLADTYTARTSERSWKTREATSTTVADLLRNVEGTINPEIGKVLVSILGIYTPGSWVVLDNGETALVVRRGKSLKTPMVLSFVSRGLALGAPVARDTSVDRFSVKGFTTMPKIDYALKPNVLWGMVVPTAG